VGQNLKGTVSIERLGQEVGDSSSQIQRYIRLTELLPELLEMVDDKKIGMRPAVELSYIPKLVQCDIWEALEQEQCTPTHEQARRMRRMSEEGKLTKEAIEAIMSEKKPNQKEKIVLRGDRFKDLFPKNLPVTKREDYVAAAMEHYGKYLERMRNAPER
jgi:ParB family chromosome partitioning protein